MKKVQLDKYFESVQNSLVITDGGRKIYLCHEPVKNFEADCMIYGHLHNGTQDEMWPTLKPMENVFNAAVEINGYAPVTIEELIFNNQAFKNSQTIIILAKRYYFFK